MKVSILCPTFHRHMYIPILIQQFQSINSDGSHDIELIIFDDTEDSYPFDDTKCSNIIYKHDNSKRFMLWEKRNLLNDMSNGDYIFCMDDDDISFKDRIIHSLQELNKNKNTLICGNSSIYIYNIFTSELFFFKSKIKSCLLNGTFAYKKALGKTNKYLKTRFNACEERSFLKNYRVPYTLLDPKKSILCIAHNSNTIDKTKFCVNKISEEESAELLSQDMRVILRQIYNVHPIVYWINIDENTRRKQSMLNQFGNSFRFHKRISAVIDPTFRYNLKNSKQEAACLDSHMIAIEEGLKKRQYDFSIICEDDIDFKNIDLLYERIFYYVKTAPKDWEILQLFNINLKLYNRKILQKDVLVWNKWTSKNFSTMIYIIKHSVGKKILTVFKTTNFTKKTCVADDFIYRNARTYSIQLPFFEEKVYDLNSDIHPDHVPMHKQYNQYIHRCLTDIKLKYPFFRI